MGNHRATEYTEVTENELTGRVIGAAIRVHKALGPGLLERVYAQCLRHELRKAEIAFEREVRLPIVYDGIRIDTQVRVDLIVERRVVVELKAVPVLHPIHTAQLLTYLRLSGLRLGLLINFNVELLLQGVRRLVNG